MIDAREYDGDGNEATRLPAAISRKDVALHANTIHSFQNTTTKQLQTVLT